ncbi:MAG TPA: hypothetical protein VKQ73_18015 [Stellaceae bacterium]|nr:hypothetical protein [Stellaceae bacterium]
MPQAPVSPVRGPWQALKTSLLAVELALLAGAILLLAVHILR